MILKQDLGSWQLGYAVGLTGQAPPPPPGVDKFAFAAGVIEGKAARRKIKPQK